MQTNILIKIVGLVLMGLPIFALVTNYVLIPVSMILYWLLGLLSLTVGIWLLIASVEETKNNE